MSNTLNTHQGIGPMRLSGFGAGSFAAALATMLPPMLLLYFLTEYVRLDPWLAGVVLAIPKLWDVVADMPIGRYSDQLAAKLGSRLRVAIWSGLALAILLPLTFYHPPLSSKALLAAFYVVIQILQAIAFTIFGVTNLAMAGDLAADAVERNKLLTMSALGGSIAGVALVIGVPVMVKAGGGGERGYVSMTLMVAAVMVVIYTFYFSSVRGMTRHAATDSGHSSGMSLRQGIADMLRNKAFVAVVIAVVAVGTAGGCLYALLAYENQYLLGRPAEDLLIVMGPTLLGNVLGLPLAVPLMRRLGDRGALRVSLVVAVITFASYWLGLVCAWTPVTVIGGALFGITNGVIVVSAMAWVLDSAKASHGGASVGLHLGMFLSGQKLGLSLGGVISGGLLSLIGYHAGAPATPELKQGIALAGLVGPLAPLLIACVVVYLPGGRTATSPRTEKGTGPYANNS
ncbi:Glucuronide carrier protein [Pandoraea horticolens]|uniref:Glucuronide carrier protein n=1 Tax=Pandoraea horticolens TaxID=2508298 RepID=A0A5E4VRH9_9BURK|nr:MFS transporter [Pandoraea horticolens]VVE14106.1 Glucuronide carrier protein [Pandoraea horticolens]